MTSIFQNINYLRYPQSFDYSKVPVINNKHKLSFDPKLAPSSWIDELRIANHIKNPPRARVIPEIDLIEQERLLRYGERVDIGAETLVERFQNMVIKVPLRNAAGVIQLDPVSNRPILRMMSFSDMLEDPPSMLYRVNQLINNLSQIPTGVIAGNQAQLGQPIQQLRQEQLAEINIINQQLLQMAASGQQLPELIPQEQMTLMSNLDNTLLNILKGVDTQESAQLRSQLQEGQRVVITAGEIIDPNNLNPLILSAIYNRYLPIRPSISIPAFIQFVKEQYKKVELIDLNDAFNKFTQSGGIAKWFPEARKEMALIQQRTGAIELTPGEEPEEFVMQPPIEIGVDISKMFTEEKLQTTGVIDKKYYELNIEQANKGEEFVEILKEMLNHDSNLGVDSFYDIKLDRFLEVDEILRKILAGTHVIKVIAPNNYVLRLSEEEEIKIEPSIPKGKPKFETITGAFEDLQFLKTISAQILSKIEPPGDDGGIMNLNWYTLKLAHSGGKGKQKVFKKIVELYMDNPKINKGADSFKRTDLRGKASTITFGGVQYLTGESVLNKIKNQTHVIYQRSANDYILAKSGTSYKEIIKLG